MVSRLDAWCMRSAVMLWLVVGVLGLWMWGAADAMHRYSVADLIIAFALAIIGAILFLVSARRQFT